MNPPNLPDPTSAPLPADVRAALEKGQWVEAIKLLRASGGMGLKEAKDLIDRQRSTAVRAKAVVEDRHRAPGEVRKVPGVVWLILVVVLAVVALVARRLAVGAG